MVPRKILFARYIWAYMCITRENDLQYLHLSTAYLHINFCISIYYISGIYYSKIIIQILKWSSRWKTINLNRSHSLIPLAPYSNGDEIFHTWLYKEFEKKMLEKRRMDLKVRWFYTGAWHVLPIACIFYQLIPWLTCTSSLSSSCK